MERALVLGASGQTGRLLVKQLIDRNIHVTAVARSDGWISEDVNDSPLFSYHQAQIAQFTVQNYCELVKDKDYVFCCLGHNLSFKGIWGKPRQLVARAVKDCCEAISECTPERQIKFVLMASTGCVNHDLNEKPPISQRIAVGLIRLLVPPHRDNELAVKYLRTVIGRKHQFVDWVIARPDGLVDIETVTDYEFVPSPIRNVIFDAGQTSRINVAHFMSDVATSAELWQHWAGKMPVLYNK